MSNIEDYLKWRGDLTLDVDPFNDVDNLILSQLAYVDFDGIVTDDAEKPMDIKEVNDRYWAMHTEEEVSKRLTVFRQVPFLFRQAALSKRFGDMKIAAYVNEVNRKQELQMSAVQFYLSDGTVYVAYRGTDESLVGWKEDFNLSYMTETEGQRMAIAYLRRYFGKTQKRLRVGGHSKGGNFAIYASAFCGPEVQNQIEAVYTNDGPGFRDEIVARPEYQKIMARTVSIVPESSVIGMLLSKHHRNKVVGSSAEGLWQHDAMTWNVLGRKFVEAKLSADSLFMDRTLHTWLSGIDDEGRKMFVDQLFAFFDAAGARTVQDIKKSSFGEAASIIKAARKLPRDQQKEFMDVLLKLIKSGGKTLQDTLKESWEAREAANRQEPEDYGIKSRSEAVETVKL